MDHGPAVEPAHQRAVSHEHDGRILRYRRGTVFWHTVAWDPSCRQYKARIYIAHIHLPSGSIVERFDNKEEAMAWTEMTASLSAE